MTMARTWGGITLPVSFNYTCTSLCNYLNCRRSATPRVLISLTLGSESTGTWSRRLEVAALDSLPKEQEGCGRNDKYTVNGKQSELSTLQSLFETALLNFILYTSTCDEDRELCRFCASNARTQQGRAFFGTCVSSSRIQMTIADYLYNHGEGQATDVSHWGFLKIEVEVGPKCESGFTYISGVFNDSGDFKSVCEAESTSMAILLRF
ncbi:hypothetical protein BJV78DRAFT_1221575 [Lactifluus subvellereus]|nr:hypothetical protein BJV78DRAFT_1221575 [Lactifluus subvellereus]